MDRRLVGLIGQELFSTGTLWQYKTMLPGHPVSNAIPN